MNIGIDGRSLTTGSKSGVQKYILYLVSGIAKLRKDITFFIFCPGLFKDKNDYLKIDNNLYHNIKVIKIPISTMLSNKRFNLFWYDYFLPLYIRFFKIDIFHGPTEILPSSNRCNKVLTIHHLWGDELNKKDEDTLTRMKSSATAADKIVTVSEVSKKNIMALWGIPEEKIQAIYNGYTQKVPNSYCKKIDKEKIILFVGSSYPRKNLMGVLKAYAILKEKKEFLHKLYIVGKEKTSEPRFYVKENNLAEDVRFFSDIDDESLDLLYRKAETFAYPSYEEGFGMPLLEALSRGTAVVASDIPVFREIIEDCAFYINPDSPEDIARGISEALTKTEEIQQKLSKSALLVKKYSWEEAAKNVIELYEKLYSTANILFFEPSSGFGGSSNALVNLIKNLDRSKFNPVVSIFNQGPRFSEIQESGVAISKLNSTYTEPSDYKGIVSYFKFILDLLFNIIPKSFQMAWLIRSHKVKLVHINTNIISGLPAILAAKLSMTPCVCHIRQTRPLIRREKIFARFVGKFICLNKTTKDMLKRDIPEEKLCLIYDGVNLDKYKVGTKGKFLKEKYCLNGNFCIGIVARLVEGKGHMDFVLAASKVLNKKPNSKFLIVGLDPKKNKPIENKLKKLAKNLGLDGNLIFTGWHDDVSGIISTFDMVVQPYTLSEGLPNILIEAMAAGKPVISTNVSGATEVVVDGETGILVKPNNPEALATATLRLLDNPDLAKKMGEAGRKRVEELFDIRNTVSHIEKIYDSLLYGN